MDFDFEEGLMGGEVYVDGSMEWRDEGVEETVYYGRLVLAGKG